MYAQSVHDVWMSLGAQSVHNVWMSLGALVEAAACKAGRQTFVM
jgi:hypothetical protein